MTGKYRVLALMTSAQSGASVVQQAVGVLGPFLIAEFSLSQAALGSLFTALYIGSSCFTALSGVLVDRLGERTMVGISGGTMTVALALATLWPSYPWLVFCMGLYGVGYAASSPAGGRAVLMWFDRDRGFAMGIRQTGVPVGGLVGALVLPFVAVHVGGYRVALLVAAALVAVPTIVACTVYREPPIDRPPPSDFRDVLRGMRQLAAHPELIAVTLTCVALVCAQLALNGFLTVTAVQVLHVPTAVAAQAFALAFVAAMIARIFWGWYSDVYMRESRPALLAILCGLSALASLAFGFLRPPSAALLFPAAFFLGFCGAGWNGVMAAATAQIGGLQRAGSAMGLTFTAVFAGSAIGPLIFGAIADRTSLPAAWIVNAAIGALGVLPVIWLRGRARPA